MAIIDAYLRSIERFGAAGAILISGQAITLRFPTGDRTATQVTSHEQLTGLVREVAPAPAMQQLEANRPARFDVDSNGTRYTLEVTPKPGVWQVVISPAAGAPRPAAAAPATQTGPLPRASSPAIAATGGGGGDMLIERGQYDEGPSMPTARAASGSGLLDQWTTAARSARATDVFIATGASPSARVGDALQPLGDRGPLDAETISRELGVVAPAEARGAWTETGIATFTYSDGMGRVRATLVRDQRGPGAALRLLVGEPPAVERLGLGREVGTWLEGRGLVLVAGPSGVGKTTTLAALVRALGDRQRRVVTLEEPIEIIVTAPTVSQRGIGEHVPTVTAGVAAAMREGADAIVVGTVRTAEAALAVVDAVAAGHLVLATISTLTTGHAANHLLGLLPADRRADAAGVLKAAFLGAIGPVVKGGSRSFEVVAGQGG